MRDLLSAVDAAKAEDLLQEWRWLVPHGDSPLFVSFFGDWVFGAQDGSLWALSLLDGDYRRVAANADEYNKQKASFEWLDEVFMAGWQEIAERQGLVPTEDQCVGWKVHPVFGGPFAAENLQLFSMRVYQSLMGQLHRQRLSGR